MGHEEEFGGRAVHKAWQPEVDAPNISRALYGNQAKALIEGFVGGALKLDDDALMRGVIEHIDVRVFWKDRESRYLGCNAVFARDAGFDSSQDLIGRTDFDCGWAAQAPAYIADDLAVMQSGHAKLDIVEPQTTPDGALIWLKTSKLPLRNASGEIVGVLGLYEDITAARQAEESLRLAASVFEHAREGIMVTNLQGVILTVNPAFTRLTGYSAEEAVGKTPALLSSRRYTKAFYQDMWQSLLRDGHWQGEIWNRRKDGELFAEMLSIGSIADESGEVTRFVALFSDITQKKQEERALSKLAYFDPLTRLPNRQLFLDRLRSAMVQAERRGALMAVAYIDLDNFKQVNDVHGHAAGDDVLVATAEAMQKVLREGDTLARFGGDEFVALLCDVGQVEHLEQLTQRLIRAAQIEFGTHPEPVLVGASVGVTLYPGERRLDGSELLLQADHALYQAKLAGRGCFRVFQHEFGPQVRVPDLALPSDPLEAASPPSPA